jgi:hypothetical protein
MQDQRKMISKWFDDVMRPRRERKSTARFGGTENDNLNRRRFQLSDAERKKLHAAFMDVGPDIRLEKNVDWEAVRTRAGLKDRSFDFLQE